MFPLFGPARRGTLSPQSILPRPQGWPARLALPEHKLTLVRPRDRLRRRHSATGVEARSPVQNAPRGPWGRGDGNGPSAVHGPRKAWRGLRTAEGRSLMSSEGLLTAGNAAALASL